MAMKLFELLKIGASAYPDNLAVIHGDKQISYRQLYEASLKVSGYLRSLNLDEGTRIGLLWENSVEYTILFFGVINSGYVLVPLDTSLKPDKLRFIIVDCGAEVLISHSKYFRNLLQIMENGSPVRFHLTNKIVKPEENKINSAVLADILKQGQIEKADQPNVQPKKIPNLEQLYDRSKNSPHQLAAIFYTSGSTGEPKGVMLSHRNLISNTIATVDYLKLTSNDKIMVILPFYYIYGNSLLLTHILVGGSLVVDNRFLYPEVILDTMEKEKVTGFSGVPSNFIILLGNSTLPERKFKHLRYFTQAGGAMAPEITAKLMSTFPDKEIYIMYGQTEAAPRVSYCPPDKLNEKIGTIGLPLNGIEIKIIDNDGRELPVGVSGELITTGDNVMLGYWNQPEATAEVLKNGWLYTGDLAKKDADGYFFITGRKKEIIKTGGNRVSAKEIEECLLENENILEAAVIGVQDELLGEAVKAVITLKEGRVIDQKEIKSFCRAKLTEHKIPKYVEFVESLPKYQSGKINKMLLKTE